MAKSGPEEFVNLQGLLVNGTLRGLHLVNGGQVPPFSSVHFRTLQVLFGIDLTGSVWLRIGSVHRVSNCFEEQRSCSSAL